LIFAEALEVKANPAKNSRQKRINSLARKKCESYHQFDFETGTDQIRTLLVRVLTLSRVFAGFGLDNRHKAWDEGADEMDRWWAAITGGVVGGEGCKLVLLKRTDFTTGSKDFTWHYKRRALGRVVSG
jgi:hypothetical protein